jgi:hypothetical protein
MAEGSSIEEYLCTAKDLKNCMASLGQPVGKKTIVQLALNTLPRSYEAMIQTISTMDQLLYLFNCLPSFSTNLTVWSFKTNNLEKKRLSACRTTAQACVEEECHGHSTEDRTTTLVKGDKATSPKEEEAKLDQTTRRKQRST